MTFTIVPISEAPRPCTARPAIKFPSLDICHGGPYGRDGSLCQDERAADPHIASDCLEGAPDGWDAGRHKQQDGDEKRSQGWNSGCT
jgi:hypothetical protein